MMRGDITRFSLVVTGLGLTAILLAGCPKTPVLAPETGAGGGGTVARPARPAYAATSALGDVHFLVDRSTIRLEDQPVLDANAAWLKSNARAQLLIEGYADERGTTAHNRTLAERRALATRDALVARGVDASRISVRAYGEERPLCSERTDSCWARNRRVHFLVKQ